MADMNEKDLERAEKQRAYLERIDTGGGDLVPTRYEPRDLPSLMDFSNMVARSGLCPQALQGKPQDVAMVLMSGAERGFTAMQALQNMHVVKGKVAMSADIIRAMCQRHPACEGFELLSVTEEKATIQVRKKSWKEAVEVEFAMEDARRAGLIRDGSAWKTFPKAMLVARATTQAARWYFPDVMAGIMEETEAKELEPEQRLASQPSAKARAAAEALASAGKPPEEEPAIDAEYVEEEPPAPEPGVKDRLEEAAAEDAEEAPRGVVPPGDAESAEELWFHELQRWVPGVGSKSAAAIIKAGYTDEEKILAATEAQLRQVEGVGERMAKNLHAWAKKRLGARAEPAPPGEPKAEAAPEPAEEAPPPAAEPPPAEEAPWGPLAAPEGLKQRPVFRGVAWMEGLRKACLEHGSTWGEIVKKARAISGGYDPARLNDPEWKILFEWVNSGTQTALPLADKSAEPEPPRYELVREHEKFSEATISAAQKAQILRWAERTGKGVDGLKRFLTEEWGYTLDALPEQLYFPAFEWATAEGEDLSEYEETVAGLLSSGQVRELT